MPTATPTTPTDLERFHRFLGEQIARGEKSLTPQEGLDRFAAYQRDVEKLNELLRPALEQVERGEYGPLDWDRLKSRVHDRLAAAGVPNEGDTNG